jgi:hypothetical protein
VAVVLLLLGFQAPGRLMEVVVREGDPVAAGAELARLDLDDLLARRSRWTPAPAVPENVNRTDMGNLGLAPGQEAALVAFLRTLNDGFTR